MRVLERARGELPGREIDEPDLVAAEIEVLDEKELVATQRVEVPLPAWQDELARPGRRSDHDGRGAVGCQSKPDRP